MSNFNLQPSQQSAKASHASMSTYFPKGTNYFYGYPAGEDSEFLNKVHPRVEELVAARAISCAGSEISVVSFASTTDPHIDSELLNELAIPTGDSDQLNVLPDHIDISVQGKKRNEAIMHALSHSIEPGSLVMAQPFNSPEVADLYQIPPELTIYLNDKATMVDYIAPELIPARFANYTSGQEFAADVSLSDIDGVLPCVVKVSSSSAGDGVYICKTPDDLAYARSDAEAINGTIYVEQFITPRKNYAVHFGIPEDQSKPIDIIGFNEQITSDDGEFLGGIIDSREFPPELDTMKDHLLRDILPKVRAMGWYGVGGFDVIINDAGNGYMIDGNYRVTGMTAYHFMVENEEVSLPLMSFGGHFTGDRSDFDSIVLPHAGKSSPDQALRLIALSNHDDIWNFNGALMYDDPEGLIDIAEQFADKGIVAPALEKYLDELENQTI